MDRSDDLYDPIADIVCSQQGIPPGTELAYSRGAVIVGQAVSGQPQQRSDDGAEQEPVKS